MQIIITGSSGLIGRALTTTLEKQGHTVRRMVRRPTVDPSEIYWDPGNNLLDPNTLVGSDAVVHLAGTGIGERRWTKNRMNQILESRTRGTQLISSALTKARPIGGPNVLISSSAIGFYGDTGENFVDEKCTSGNGFLANVCAAWEDSTKDAEAAGIRVAHCRTGVVLSSSGGILPKLLPLFRLGLGGRNGSGQQFMSWISMTDEISALIWLIEKNISGAVNLVAPEPVTNAEFTKTLGSVLRRPAKLVIPSNVPAVLYGRQMVREVLMASTRAKPQVLESSDFVFRYPLLKDALISEIQTLKRKK